LVTTIAVRRTESSSRSELPAAAPVATRIAEPPRDRIYGAGVIVALPSLGTLSWQCSDSSHFVATYTAARPFATQHVSVTGGGASRRWTLTPGRRAVSAPAQGIGAQRWSMTIETEPAGKIVRVAVRYAATASSRICYVRRYSVSAVTTVHER
jgi:hypothetical protein